MLPEIIHSRPEKKETTFGKLKNGTFFTFTRGGLFQKINDQYSVIFETLPGPGEGGQFQTFETGSNQLVIPKRVRIEVLP